MRTPRVAIATRWLAPLLLLAAGHATAIEAVDDYARRATPGQVVSPLGEDLFGDRTSYYTGTTTFAVTDVSLPGNGTLPVAIGRTHTVGAKSGKFGELHDGPAAPGLFGEWDLDIPYLHGTFSMLYGWQVVGANPDARCSAPSSPATMRPPDQPYFFGDAYWSGNFLHLPGQGEQRMLLATTPTSLRPQGSAAYRWNTTGHWYFSCTTLKNGAGEGFVGHAPDGTRYYFDWLTYQRNAPILKWDVKAVVERQIGFLYPSRVEDRFGNWVTYTWAGSELQSIQSSDGRKLTLSYVMAGADLSRSAKVSTISDGTRTWRYEYAPTGFLQKVTLPDGSAWHLQTAVPSFETVREGGGPGGCGVRRLYAPQEMTYRMTHPSGAVGEFLFKPLEHGRARVFPACDWDYTRLEDRNRSAGTYFFAISLLRKTITGTGMSAREWNVAYDTGYPGSWGDCATCSTVKHTQVTDNAGDFTHYTFSTHFGHSEGQLLERKEGRNGATMRRSVYYADTTDVSPSPAYIRNVGVQSDHWGKDPTDEMLVPQRGGDIIQDWVTYSWRVDGNCNGTLCFDAFARALQVRRYSSLGYSKTDTVDFHDDQSSWTLGQLLRSATNGIETTRAEFDEATALPIATYAFGKLQQLLTYHVDGMPESITDGNGNTTTYTDWKRGIPQTVRFPATPDAQSGATKTATANDAGWITSVTDEIGARTCYEHDAMGRVSKITYPSETQPGVCDASAWNPTTIAFDAGHAAAYGLSAGHWRQTTQTGNARQVVFFDALWRPVVEQLLDVADTAGTMREVVRRFDASGRQAFESYPMNTGGQAVHTDTALNGVHTTYDGLGRVTRVEEDSELGRLATTTEYFGGNTETKRPGFVRSDTQVSYMAFDSPTEAWPVTVSEPEGTYTQITRDVFGKLTAIRRHNYQNTVSLTRHFVYDAHQRLCKSVEPETGATVLVYDAADNLSWSAAGLLLPDPGTCDRNEAFDSGRRVVREYDGRNRPTVLDFPDGNGSQQWTYRPDGLVVRIDTINDGVATTNTYDYHLRGLLRQETQAPAGEDPWVLSYAYDPNGYLASLTYPSGETFPFAPNALGQPRQAGTLAADALFHPNGALKRLRYGDGTVRTMEQNARGFPDRIRDASDTRVLFDEGLDYDVRGNLVANSDGLSSRRDRTMWYDDRDRLRSLSSAGGGSASYKYDLLDNLTSMSIPSYNRYDVEKGGSVFVPGRQQTFLFDTSNRLTNVVDATTGASVVGLGYDAQGNLVNRNGRVYAFDYGNRLRKVTGLERYRYDGHGRRVSATTDDAASADIRSMYGLDGVLRRQHDERTGTTTDYIHLAGTLVAQAERLTVPVAPQLDASGYSSDGHFTVTWTAVGGAATYELEEHAGAWVRIYAGTERTRAFQDKIGGSWGYRVRACNAAGCGVWSNEVAVFVQVRPSSPAAISVPTWGPNGHYTVSWLPPAVRDVGEITYQLEERIGQGAWTLAYEGPALERAFSERPDQRYAYRVTACNPFGCSEAIAGINSVRVIYPPAPTELSVPGPQWTDTYSISWSSVADASRYEVDEQHDGGTWARIYNSPHLSTEVSRRGSGLYGYRARACNIAGCGAYTPVHTVQVTLPPTAKPTLILPANSNTGSFTITWTAIAHVTRYELQERYGSGGFALIHDGPSSSFTRTALGGGTWGYQVRACNAAGCGPWSTSKWASVVPIHRAELVSFEVNGIATQAGGNGNMVYGELQHIEIKVRNTGTHAWNAPGYPVAVLRRNDPSFPMPDYVWSSTAVVQPGEIAVFQYTYDPPYGPVSPMPFKHFGGGVWLHDVQHLFDIPVRSFSIENPSGYCQGSVCQEPR